MFFRSGFELDFRDYQPASELIVPVTQNVRPKFPVIDAHIHLGAKYPGEAFYNRYRIGSMVSLMREAGIYHAVDLELFSEDCFYKDSARPRFRNESASWQSAEHYINQS